MALSTMTASGWLALKRSVSRMLAVEDLLLTQRGRHGEYS